MKKFIFAAGLLAITSTLSACGGGGGSAATLTPSPQPVITPPVQPQPTVPSAPDGMVIISGNLTFEAVNHAPLTHGLDYDAITQKPARGLSVEAVDASGTVIASGVSGAQGQYSVTVPDNATVRIRVSAQLYQPVSAVASSAWDVRVTDNTQGDALYVMQGDLVSAGTADQVRNITAKSGWDSIAGSYTGSRSAAPFAILDPIYDGISALTQLDPTVTLPPLTVHWSVNNKSVATTRSSAARAAGDIGTSFYDDGSIYILGDADNDTDEYDRHVIVHEWAHYIEDRLSRADSIGGNHGGADRLDPRVAFSEGLGNALSAMILGDPVYRDSGGLGQAYGFAIDVENNSYANTGWFNEGSVQSIIYDIFDSAADGIDNLSLGLAPIHAALTSPHFTQNNAFTTIFSFIDQVKTTTPASAADIDKLLLSQSIYGRGAYGEGESNAGGISASLPVYKALSLGAAPVEVCSDVQAGYFNKLGNRSFAALTIETGGTYRLTLERISGAVGRNPDFYIYQAGALVGSANVVYEDLEIWEGQLEAGSYVIDAHGRHNLTHISTAQGSACYALSVSG